MPSVSGANPSGNYFARKARWCEVSATWGGAWTYVNWLRPLRCTRQTNPGVGRAAAERCFGMIKQNDQSTASLYAPVDLSEHFLRIRTQEPGQAAVTVWHGFIVDTATTLTRPDYPAGQQVVQALALDYLLERRTVDRSFAVSGGTELEIDRVLTFNRRHNKGRSLKGNRSETKGSDGCYRFSKDGKIWTARDVAEYLLVKFAPGSAFRFKLAGQDAALDALVDEWDLAGRTVREALDVLIDRRHGLCYSPRVGQPPGSGSAGPEILLWVNSIIDVAVTSGGKTLPANDSQVSFTLPTQWPYSHLVDPLTFRKTALNTVDVIEAVSELLLVTATFSYPDGTLTEGWKPSKESTYKFPGSTEAEENDRQRAREYYQEVYTRHVVPPSWDGRTWDGEHANGPEWAIPKATKVGTFDTAAKGTFWSYGKQFATQTVLEKGMDYTKSPPEDLTVEDTEPEFLPPLVLIKDADDGAFHTHDNEWRRVDKMHEESQYFKSCAVRVLDRQLGFELTVEPNHYFALSSWGSPDASNHEPEFDYKQLLVTATFETDQRAKVERRITGGNAAVERRLQLQVRGAEYWYVVPNTAVGTDTNGNLQRVHADNVWVRKDQELLEAEAAYAFAWYCVLRQAIEIPIKQVGLYVEPGDLLTGCNVVASWVPVRTVVTSCTIDFEQDATTVETGWGGLDFYLTPGAFHGRGTRVGRGKAA